MIHLIHINHFVLQVGKEAGRLWREMPEAKKKQWNDAAVKDKARYHKEIDAFNKKKAKAARK